MKDLTITIDKDMQDAINAYEKLLNNPDINIATLSAYESARRKALSMLLAKIETAKMKERLSS